MSYFAALIVVTAVAGVVTLAANESTAPGRALRLTAALAVISVALSPLAHAKERVTALVSSFGDFVASASGEDVETAAERYAAREFSAAISARVCTQFALAPDRVTVAVTLDADGAAEPKLAAVRVSIAHGDATPDPDEVTDFVASLTGVPAETVILAPP